MNNITLSTLGELTEKASHNGADLGHNVPNQQSRVSLLIGLEFARCFMCTNRMLMSDGDTPEMRDAWPTVTGRNRLSFCRASMRKLGTAA